MKYTEDYKENIKFKNNYGIYFEFLKSELKINLENSNEREVEFIKAINDL